MLILQRKIIFIYRLFMKIVFLSQWYSENMGYAENCLPEALAKLGHDVHIVTTVGQVYFNQPHYEASYGKFLGKAIQPEGTKIINGVKVHRLPMQLIKKQILIIGLNAKIHTLKPDIVHAFTHADINVLRLVFAKLFTPFKLFTANHTSYLAFEVSKKENNTEGVRHDILRFLIHTMPGRFISWFTEKCFAVTSDAGIVASSVFGVQKHKVKVTTLGVNTDLFKANAQVKTATRAQLGLINEDIVCLYSGKFSALKNPIILAQAIEKLNAKSLNIKGLFIGDGEQYADILAIKNCLILPYQQQIALAQYYQTADIAVWPFGESSSQLDAVATGLCLVMSDSVQAYDRVEANTSFEENGQYRPKIISRICKSNDVDDLVRALETLADKAERQRLGALGEQEVIGTFSWTAIAKRRLVDYGHV
jgi:glycosyltransferase involved in cell wall biosynthesis